MCHAHVYFPYSTEADKEKADKFQAAIKARFADDKGVRFGAIAPQAAGPHPLPQFETTFTKSHLVDVLPWLMFNRPEGFSILVHPFTAKVVRTGMQSLPTPSACLLEKLAASKQHAHACACIDACRVWWHRLISDHASIPCTAMSEHTGYAKHTVKAVTRHTTHGMPGLLLFATLPGEVYCHALLCIHLTVVEPC